MNKNSWNDTLPGADALKSDGMKSDTQKSDTTTPSTSFGASKTPTATSTTPSTSYGTMGSSYEKTDKLDNKTSKPKKDDTKTLASDGMGDARDAKGKLDEAISTGRHALDNVQGELERRPYVAMGVAAGVAFGVGTILGSRLLRWASVLGAGYAVAQLMRSENGKRVGETVRARVEELIEGARSKA